MPRCAFHDKWCRFDGPHLGLCEHRGKGGRALHQFPNDKYPDEYAGGHRIRPTLPPGVFRDGTKVVAFNGLTVVS